MIDGATQADVSWEGPWKRVFTLLPVALYQGGWVWLRTVERRERWYFSMVRKEATIEIMYRVPQDPWDGLERKLRTKGLWE
jgi:hypothetical protein